MDACACVRVRACVRACVAGGCVHHMSLLSLLLRGCCAALSRLVCRAITACRAVCSQNFSHPRGIVCALGAKPKGENGLLEGPLLAVAVFLLRPHLGTALLLGLPTSVADARDNCDDHGDDAHRGDNHIENCRRETGARAATYQIL